MAIADQKSSSDGTVWGFFKRPFRPSGSTTVMTSSTSSSHNAPQHINGPQGDGSNPNATNSVSSVTRSLLPTRRRLKLDPHNKLYFPCEPGKQVRSAIRIKNTSKSYIAFKALELFRKQGVDYLIATDVAARGLDIIGVQAVINYACPRDLTSHVYPDLSIYNMDVSLSYVNGTIGVSLEAEEDVAIAYGYNNIPKRRPASSKPLDLNELIDHIKFKMVGFVIGLIPQIRKLLIVDGAPLRVVQDTASFLALDYYYSSVLV